MCNSGSASQKIFGKRLNTSQGKNPNSKIGITTTIMKCNVCGLVYSNPLPIPFDIQDHYGVPPENYWKEEYFITDDNYFSSNIERLKKIMRIDKGAKALDIGAGIGKCMVALNKEGFESYGIEPSQSFYERALERMGIMPDRLKLGKIEDVDYPENEFDFITFGAVLEHLYNPSDAIIKAVRWLKPGGVIHIEVPSSKWLINKIVNFYYKIKGTDYVGNISPMHFPFHLYEFDLKSFEEHGKQNKYKIVFYQHYICNTYMPRFIDPLLKYIMRKSGTGMQLAVWLQKY